jgi:uncharacterized surface protein with fasciclin (FAS1) repeats
VNLLDKARQDPDLALAVILIEKAGLVYLLSCTLGPFTAQLPTNQAVMNIDADALDFLLQPANQDKLQDLMLYHIVPGNYTTADLQPGPLPTLLQGTTVEVSLNPTMFNTANVVTADIMACNGNINTVDQILTPGTFRVHPLRSCSAV